MNTVTLHFKADNQQLTALDGLYKLASNTVEYVKAIFTLGENWAGFDVVRAAWYTDFECISTVLDGNGECFVPWEVLSRPEGVTINLYGCDLEEESDGEAVLVDRLTTYPVKAILVDVDARVCGSETKPVTPSQFEQYIAIVQELVGTVRDITSCVLNPDYTLTINYSDDTSDTVGPIRGEQGEQGLTGPAGNGISKIEKISTAGLVDTYRITFTNGTHKDYTVTNGAKGDTGNGIESIYLTGTSGAVKTYTILFTNGNTFEYQVTDGEVTRAELEAVLPTDTASGAIASFPDGSDLFDYLSCVVDIDPVQDLHGYDKPWVGGAGKNKLDVSAWTTGNLNAYTGEVTPNNNRMVSPFILLKSGTYTVSRNTSNPYWKASKYDTNKTFVSSLFDDETANKTFTLSEDSYIRIGVDGIVTESNHLQLESGSTVTTYSPYSNICPITGWTGCEVDVVGFNQWDEEWELGVYASADGAPYPSITNIRSKQDNYIPVVPSKTYYFNTSGKLMEVYRYDADKVYIDKVNVTNGTITFSDNVYFVRFDMASAYGTTYGNDISINYPSTDTTYHAHNPNSAVYPVSWQTEAGTVYGGTVDLVTGVLTVTWGYSNLGVLNYSKSRSPQRFEATTTLPNAKAPTSSSVALNGLCTEYKIYSIDAYSGQDSAMYMSTTGLLRIYDSSRYSLSASDFKTAMNNVYLAYELATPQTYQLDPVQVACLLGQNNVWADCGDTSVTYKADVQRWVEKKLGA